MMKRLLLTLVMMVTVVFAANAQQSQYYDYIKNIQPYVDKYYPQYKVDGHWLSATNDYDSTGPSNLYGGKTLGVPSSTSEYIGGGLGKHQIRSPADVEHLEVEVVQFKFVAMIGHETLVGQQA